MHVVVAGSSGFIGSALVPALRGHGHTVRLLVRRPVQRADEIRWDPAEGRLDPDDLAGVDAVVDLAGVNAASRPLTPARKREVVASRVDSAGLLARTLAAETGVGAGGRPRILLQASGIGAYGDRGDDVLDEQEPIGDTFFAGVVRQWEAATAPAADAGVRVALLRTGIVLGPSGGALGRLLPLVRLGVGGRLGSGRQLWPWITVVDEVRAIEHLLTTPVHGPVNLVTRADRNVDVIRALADAFGRPAAVPVPAWALRTVLGDFSSEVLGSIGAVPAVLAASGFRPVHADLPSAARWVASGV